MSRRRPQSNTPKMTAARQAAVRPAMPHYTPETPLPPRRFTPPRLRLLPITMMMLVLLLGVKLSDVYRDGMELNEMIASAQAEDKPAAEADKKAEAKPDEKAEAAKAEEEAAPADAIAGDEKPATDEEKADKKEEPKPEEVKLASLEEDPKADKNKPQQFSQIELDILQNLKVRREELEKQGAELDLKEKLLDATELRVNDKLKEMKDLQKEVEKLLEAYNTQEDGKLQGLVKIYENMKPKDAAQIFNELDMPILLEVVDRMSERKVAPILAGMDPMKAKELTVELAEYRKLKSVPRTLSDAQAQQ